MSLRFPLTKANPAEDRELLELGVQLEEVIRQWKAQLAIDRHRLDVWEAACERPASQDSCMDPLRSVTSNTRSEALSGIMKKNRSRLRKRPKPTNMAASIVSSRKSSISPQWPKGEREGGAGDFDHAILPTKRRTAMAKRSISGAEIKTYLDEALEKHAGCEGIVTRKVYEVAESKLANWDAECGTPLDEPAPDECKRKFDATKYALHRQFDLLIED
jgi:hypothetical protein